MMAQSKSIESYLMNIQQQFKGAIADYQILQRRLSADRENVEVRKELNAMKEHIVNLGASQRPYMKLLRMKNAIKTKSRDNTMAVPEKKMRLEEEVKLKAGKEIPAEEEQPKVETQIESSAGLCRKLMEEFEEEKENIAHSVDKNIGIAIEPQKLNEKERFLSCIGLVTLERSSQVSDAVQKYKAEYALKHPLLEIPKADHSKRRRTETYLSCVQKKRKEKQREPSSEKETGESKNPEDTTKQNGHLIDLPDQPFNEHQWSQGSIGSNPEDLPEEETQSQS
ncbi:uncharacterized protein LOC135936124 [Cloeon dipterum]|uniref:uncharacterized protein LOC135936124 n=1 Tax=Cloeon dipterum TaxID=197152 RepID=UPI003220331B